MRRRRTRKSMPKTDDQQIVPAATLTRGEYVDMSRELISARRRLISVFRDLVDSPAPSRDVLIAKRHIKDAVACIELAEDIALAERQDAERQALRTESVTPNEYKK